MKISRPWLQRYFDTELPSAKQLGEALTFHAFEIESIENDVLDVKVTANRGHDCLCHRGIAKEVSAILQIPMKRDPLREEIELSPTTEDVSVTIASPLCKRYIAGYIRGVKVAPSPEWLRKSLEEIGQRSINNVVDATNFVMFDLGQPMHAFDAGKLPDVDGRYAIEVRAAREGERLIALDGKEYDLTTADLVIGEEPSSTGIGIAGVKGGAPAAITEETEDIIIEAANFEGVSVRKTAKRLNLRTDASSRFEQVISPELAEYGIRAVVNLILEIAGGTLVGFADQYPDPPRQRSVSVTGALVSRLLGSAISDFTIADVFTRLDLPFTKIGNDFSVEPPFERLDLAIPQDLVEEVGRTVGYDAIQPEELPPLSVRPTVNTHFYGAEQAREDLMSKGYSEVFTSVFTEQGDRVIANKIDGVRAYLRKTLVEGLREVYEKNNRNKDLLGLKDVRLFEIGVIWVGGNEITMLGVADEQGIREEPLPSIAAPEAYELLPLSEATRYQTFSKYPFIVRDISMWVPDTDEARGVVINTFAAQGGDLLRRAILFDQFKRDGRNSLAFRLVFQSFDRTLTDLDANERMDSISRALQAHGFEIR